MFGVALILLFAGSSAQAADWQAHEMRRLHSSETVNLEALIDKRPVLMVNTASRCGFTGQFEGLEVLHQRYGPKGLAVVGFSSNDFNQEIDEEGAADVCFVNFGVTFDMLAPVHVRGENAHPVFAELARQSEAPRWNFTKYLVSSEGEVVAHFPSNVRPESGAMRSAIEDLL
ncbi:glutathione peroxidase [Vreelandella azerica]|uniref:glutathione peroxidase n=1 Tax=Vreelandella azerica TaxID=2732867 RepID=UPI002E2DEBAD|nr:glutathione peroxidase [Halomonas azerica]